MKRSQRIISLLLALVMLAGIAAGCGKTGSGETEEFITRGEWITMLGQQFGMDEYTSDESFFQDVTQEDDIYPYVQACTEWGVLNVDDGSSFRPSEIAKVEFAIECGLRAADIEIEDDSLLEYAVKRGILPDKSYMSAGAKLDRTAATAILAWVLEECLSAPFEECVDIDFADDVVLMNSEEEIYPVEENLYYTKENPEQLESGTVAIFPGDKDNPDGVAKKVVDIYTDESENYVVVTEEPDIDEFCENVEIAVTAIPKVEDIQVAEGVTLRTGAEGMCLDEGNEYFVSKLTTVNGVKAENKGVNFGLDINFTKGTIKPNTDWENLFGKGGKVSVSGEEAYTYRAGLTDEAGQLFEKTSIIPDKNLIGEDPYDNTEAINEYKAGLINIDELKEELNLSADQQEKDVSCMTNKFTGGYEIVGSLNVKNLYVQPEFKLKKVAGIPTGLKSFEITINYEVSSSLALKGKLSEELTVCTIPIPVASTGVTVDLKLSLFADLNGEIKVTATVTNMTKTVYEDGKTKKMSDKSSELGCESAAKLEFGPKFAVVVRFMGIGIVDADVKCAVRIKASADMSYKTEYTETDDSIKITRKTELGYSIKGFVPIISLGIGNSKDTLANKLRLKFSWEVVGEKQAYHFILLEKELTIWEDEHILAILKDDRVDTILDKNEDVTDEAKSSTDSQQQTSTWGDYLTIDRYYVSLAPNESKSVAVTNIPAGYTAEDLIWEISDTSVATVHGGMIVGGTDGGTTVLTVRTADGVYSAQCTIVVLVDSSDVEFVPLGDYGAI